MMQTTSAFIGFMVVLCIQPFATSAQENKLKRKVVVAVGAAGDQTYESQFAAWAKRWEEAADSAGADLTLIGLDDSNQSPDHQLLKTAVTKAVENDPDELWIVLIGHGTFDGKFAKFNLRGPDVPAQDLAAWLQPRTSATIIINSSSASSPFINRLAADNRIVITATKSGHQHNFARFGDFFSAAINDENIDLDKDNQTSVLEAFLAASKRTQEFYTDQGWLATEHALLDDNGDAKGTPADWYKGIRATAKSADGTDLDGLRANQVILVQRGELATLSAEDIAERNSLEVELESLRQKKGSFTEDEYFRQLEIICLKLARLYGG